MKYLIITTMCLCSCSYINDKLGLKDDNFIEELLEDEIKIKTGLEIDLSPRSIEEKK